MGTNTDIADFLHNVTFMGARTELVPFANTTDPYVLSFFGKMSDINLWSRILTRREIYNWMNCAGSMTGDLASWETDPTGQFDITGARITEIDKEQVCRGVEEEEEEESGRIFVSVHKRNFTRYVR